MRYIEIKLDSTPIQMEPVTIRQYNNLVDTVIVQLKSDMDGLVVADYNVFVQTDLVRRDKIPLTPCSSVDIVVEEGYLGYTWPIDSAVTRYKGVLQFEVQLEHKTDAAIPIWQSEVCKLITVAPNICDNTSLGDDGPAILQEVYQQLQTLDDQAGQAAASAADASESKRLAATHERTAKSHAEQTGEDRIATGEDKVATGADRLAVNAALTGFAETTLPNAIQAVEDKADTEIARVGQASDTQIQAVNAAGAEQIGLATAQADRAESEADIAATSAGAALSAKQAAETAQGKAEDAQVAAATSATNAAASNQNAATHEQAAKGYADAAAQSNTAAGLSATAAAEFAGLVSTAVNHRNIYRGKSLGTSVTAAQKTAISSGTFDDLFIGDYWTINSVKWVIADMDYWYNCGDTAFTRHHLVIVPSKNLYSAVMNAENITTGGYVGSLMYTENLESAKATIAAAFGSMVLTHREYLVNAVTAGAPSAGAWFDSSVELMNEPMVYGSYIHTAGSNGGAIVTRHTTDKTQLALFALTPRDINTREYYWLRDVVSAAYFAYVYILGSAHYGPASNSYGVRPVFPIG